jgi:hypothetical protein
MSANMCLRPLRRSIVVLLSLLVACTSPSQGEPSGTPTGGESGSQATPTPMSTSTTTRPPPDSGPVGYVGCSNSAAAVNGYHVVGGNRFWPLLRDYGGGSVTQWAEGIGGPANRFWSAFTRQQEQTPAHVFWLQLCPIATENQDNDDEALAIVAEIRRRVPDAVVYISALNDWVAPHVCAICGAQGPENMRADAAEVIATGEALKGPRLPALEVRCSDRECGVSSAGATTQNNQVEPDGCHPNESGEILLGETLKRFFG